MIFKKITLLGVLALLCLNFVAHGQFYKPSEKTIRMGESLPESFYQTIHQAVDMNKGTATKMQLKDYRSKLIILDFWATWCGPCIYSLGKLDSLQKAMKRDDVLIIPVTYQTMADVLPVLKKNKITSPSIVSDNTLAQVFSHNALPYQVWIRDNRVVAIPRWEYATEQNILAFASGRPAEMMMDIQDVPIDPLKPLFITGNGDTGQSPYFKGEHSLIARRLPNFGQHGLRMQVKGDTTILYCWNLPIRPLFYRAFEDEIYSGLSNQEGSGVYWEISDRLRKRFFEGPARSWNADLERDKLYEKWQDKNVYGYNLRYPVVLNRHEALKIMQADLNAFFGAYLGLEAKIESRLKKVALLYSVEGTTLSRKLLASSGGKTFISDPKTKHYKLKNASYQNLHLLLAAVYPNTPLVDSTGIAADERLRIDLEFAPGIQADPKLAASELARYGLSLKMVEKMLPVLVIRERGQKL